MEKHKLSVNCPLYMLVVRDEKVSENLPNSLCHFWQDKPVFLQILDQSSVPSKYLLYYFSTLDKRIPSKSQFWALCYSENFTNFSCYLWKHKSVFHQIFHQYSVPSYRTPLHFYSSNITYFVSKAAH